MNSFTIMFCVLLYSGLAFCAHMTYNNHKMYKLCKDIKGAEHVVLQLKRNMEFFGGVGVFAFFVGNFMIYFITGHSAR